MNELKIPKERIAVLIGKKGQDKKNIEKITNTKIKVSKEGDVEITADDNFNIFLTSNIIKAIARGFNPEVALTLLNEDNYLEIINMQEEIGKSKKKLIRMKARVIGTNGKAKYMVEKMTNTNISVYGKTIAIIGKSENVLIAKQALQKILQGSMHGNVYKFVENQKHKFK